MREASKAHALSSPSSKAPPSPPSSSAIAGRLRVRSGGGGVSRKREAGQRRSAARKRGGLPGLRGFSVATIVIGKAFRVILIDGARLASSE